MEVDKRGSCLDGNFLLCVVIQLAVTQKLLGHIKITVFNKPPPLSFLLGLSPLPSGSFEIHPRSLLLLTAQLSPEVSLCLHSARALFPPEKRNLFFNKPKNAVTFMGLVTNKPFHYTYRNREATLPPPSPQSQGGLQSPHRLKEKVIPNPLSSYLLSFAPACLPKNIRIF